MQQNMQLTFPFPHQTIPSCKCSKVCGKQQYSLMASLLQELGLCSSARDRQRTTRRKAALLPGTGTRRGTHQGHHSLQLCPTAVGHGKGYNEQHFIQCLPVSSQLAAIQTCVTTFRSTVRRVLEKCFGLTWNLHGSARLIDSYTPAIQQSQPPRFPLPGCKPMWFFPSSTTSNNASHILN